MPFPSTPSDTDIYVLGTSAWQWHDNPSVLSPADEIWHTYSGPDDGRPYMADWTKPVSPVDQHNYTDGTWWWKYHSTPLANGLNWSFAYGASSDFPDSPPPSPSVSDIHIENGIKWQYKGPVLLWQVYTGVENGTRPDYADVTFPTPAVNGDIYPADGTWANDYYGGGSIYHWVYDDTTAFAALEFPWKFKYYTAPVTPVDVNVTGWFRIEGDTFADAMTASIPAKSAHTSRVNLTGVGGVLTAIPTIDMSGGLLGGEILHITNISELGDSFTFQEDSLLPGSKIRMPYSTLELGYKEVATFHYSGGVGFGMWVLDSTSKSGGGSGGGGPWDTADIVDGAITVPDKIGAANTPSATTVLWGDGRWDTIGSSGNGDVVADGKAGGQHIYGGPNLADELALRHNTIPVKTVKIVWQGNTITSLPTAEYPATLVSADSGKSLTNVREAPNLLIADDWCEAGLFEHIPNTNSGYLIPIQKANSGFFTFNVTATLTRVPGAPAPGSRTVTFTWNNKTIVATGSTVFSVNDEGAVFTNISIPPPNSLGAQETPPDGAVFSYSSGTTDIAAPYARKYALVDLVSSRGTMFEGTNIIGGDPNLRKSRRPVTFTCPNNATGDVTITRSAGGDASTRFFKSDIGMTLHRSAGSKEIIPDGSIVISTASDFLSAVVRLPAGTSTNGSSGTAQLGVFWLSQQHKNRANDLYIGHNRKMVAGEFATDPFEMSPIRISLDYDLDGMSVVQMPNTYVPGPGGLINVDGKIRMGKNLSVIDNFSGAVLNSTRSYANRFGEDTNPGGFLMGIIWSDNFNSSLGKSAIREILPYTSNVGVRANASGEALCSNYYGMSNQDFLTAESGSFGAWMGNWTGYWFRPPYLTGDLSKTKLQNAYGIQYGIQHTREIRIKAKRTLSVTRGGSTVTYTPDVSDASGYDVLSISLDGSGLTLGAPAWGASSPTIGQRLVIELRQQGDGVIPWNDTVWATVAWNPIYTFASSPVIGTAKYQTTGYLFEWNGTNWVEQEDEVSLWEARYGGAVITAIHQGTGLPVNAFSKDDIGMEFGKTTTALTIPNYPAHAYVRAIAPVNPIFGTTTMAAMHLPYTDKVVVVETALFARGTMAPYDLQEGDSTAARLMGQINLFPTGNRNITETKSGQSYNAATVLEFGSGPSYGSEPPPFINSNGQYRITYSAQGIMPSYTRWAARVGFLNNGLTTGAGFVHNVAGIIETDPLAANGTNIGLHSSFRSKNTYTARGATDVTVAVEDHLSHIQFAMSAGDFATTMSAMGFVSRSTHDAGTWVGKRRGFIVEDAEGAGKYVSQVGFYSEFLTNGLSNYGFFAEPAPPGNTDYKAASFAGTTIDGFGNLHVSGDITIDGSIEVGAGGAIGDGFSKPSGSLDWFRSGQKPRSGELIYSITNSATTFSVDSTLLTRVGVNEILIIGDEEMLVVDKQQSFMVKYTGTAGQITMKINSYRIPAVAHNCTVAQLQAAIDSASGGALAGQFVVTGIPSEWFIAPANKNSPPVFQVQDVLVPAGGTLQTLMTIKVKRGVNETTAVSHPAGARITTPKVTHIIAAGDSTTQGDASKGSDFGWVDHLRESLDGKLGDSLGDGFQPLWRTRLDVDARWSFSHMSGFSGPSPTVFDKSTNENWSLGPFNFAYRIVAGEDHFVKWTRPGHVVARTIDVYWIDVPKTIYGNWATSTSYDVGDRVTRSGSQYVCTTIHTSGTTTAPGTGINWEDVWAIFLPNNWSFSFNGLPFYFNNTNTPTYPVTPTLKRTRIEHDSLQSTDIESISIRAANNLGTILSDAYIVGLVVWNTEVNSALTEGFMLHNFGYSAQTLALFSNQTQADWARIFTGDEASLNPALSLIGQFTNDVLSYTSAQYADNLQEVYDKLSPVSDVVMIGAFEQGLSRAEPEAGAIVPAWSAATTYNPGDYVTYQGATYAAGQKISGAAKHPAKAWADGTVYATYEQVIVNNATYECIVGHTASSLVNHPSAGTDKTDFWYVVYPYLPYWTPGSTPLSKQTEIRTALVNKADALGCAMINFYDVFAREGYVGFEAGDTLNNTVLGFTGSGLYGDASHQSKKGTQIMTSAVVKFLGLG